MRLEKQLSTGARAMCRMRACGSARDPAHAQEVGGQLVGVVAAPARTPLGVRKVALTQRSDIHRTCSPCERRVGMRPAHAVGEPAHLSGEIAQLPGIGHVRMRAQHPLQQRRARTRHADDEDRDRAIGGGALLARNRPNLRCYWRKSQALAANGGFISSHWSGCWWCNKFCKPPLILACWDNG